MNKILKAAIPVVELIDETFNSTLAKDCHLSMQLGKDEFLFAVFDIPRNKYIVLKSFVFHKLLDIESAFSEVETIWSSDPAFGYSFKSCSLGIINRESTLVPVSLFDERKKKDFLKFNQELSEKDLVFFDRLRNVDAVNVYCLPESVSKKFSYKFQGIKILHSSTSLIESVLAQNRNTTVKKAHVHIKTTHFEIIITEGKKLLFYNSFDYRSAEDFMFYLLYAAEQLKLNPEEAEFVISGEIEKKSAVYSLLHKYIRNLKFGERIDGLGFSYKLEQLPSHFYFNLYSQYLCVS